MDFPFISMRSHRETIAAKDETIAVLRETLSGLQQSLKALEELAQAAKPKPFLARPRGETSERVKPLDYAKLDPNDNEALAAAAKRELGPGKHTVSRLQNRMLHIKRQVLLQRAAQADKAGMPMVAPPPPAAIAEQIEQAVRDGEAAAAAGAQ